MTAPTMDGGTVAADLCERDLQKQVRAMAEQFGWRVAVTWSSLHSPRGWPDLFCVRGAEFCAIELKVERGKVSEYQQAWLDALRALPGARFVGVIRPSSWYAGVLDEVLRIERAPDERYVNADRAQPPRELMPPTTDD